MSEPVANEAPRNLRVFLVDDHAMFRAGVRAELRAFVDVVGEAGTVPTPWPRSPRCSPIVVLLDVHMPDGGGRAVLERCASQPDVKFLALSVSDAAEDVIGLIRAGARGYVTKTISPSSLPTRYGGWPTATQSSARGWLGSSWTPSRPGRTCRWPIRSWIQLTNRERRCLRLLARGYAYKEIAKELYISIKTVETHVSQRAAQAADVQPVRDCPAGPPIAASSDG
jgi:DNA-binding NarL/FixJ family response regulator